MVLLLLSVHHAICQQAYNEIKTEDDPLSITLSDGSTVWLNTKTTLGYPPAFSAKQNAVQLNGEAYFKIVSGNKQIKIGELLLYPGTGSVFNISQKDSAITIAMVQGNAKLSVSNKLTGFKSGQQAIVNNKAVNIVSIPDGEEPGNWRSRH